MKELRAIGIQPDVLLCRTDRVLPPEVKQQDRPLLQRPGRGRHQRQGRPVDLRGAAPRSRREGLDEILLDLLSPAALRPRPLASGRASSTRDQEPGRTKCDVGVVGKYVDYGDSYKSLNEALAHGGIANNVRVKLHLHRRRDARRRLATPTCSSRVDAHPRAGRLRPPRRRGQDARHPLRPREEGAVLRHLPRHADARSSSTPATSPASRAPTRPSSTTSRRTG